jgi:hypothetical protein
VISKSIAKYGIAILITLCSVLQINGQEVIENIDELSQQDGSREEIQRYFGYEDLLFRFTTLPYDVSQGTNQVGRFVDIGYLLLALLPVVILGLTYRKRKLFYTIASLFLVYLSTCFIYSRIFTEAGVLRVDNFDSAPPENLNILDNFLGVLYKSAHFILSPFINGINNVVEGHNSIVYLFLFTAFVLPFVFIKRYSLNRSLWIIFGAYGFLWLLLSGGILWYGFLLIPLGLILVFNDFNLQTQHNTIVRFIGLGLCVIWIFLSGFSRISYLDYRYDEGEHAGKSIINANLFPYAVGVHDEQQTLDFASPYVSKALERINGDNKYVYMIGTSFAFNIENNISRIFQDNLLANYTRLVNRYEEKDILISALKSSDFGYIVVDLNTPTLDQTPEKSLTQKYRLLLNMLYANPDVSLIATDRVVEFIDTNGNPQKIANVFGESIVTPGTYAIYEIL